MEFFFPTKQDFEAAVESSVRRVVSDEVPKAVSQALKSESLDTDQCMEEYGWDKRRQQYLRDSGQISYYKVGRRILYKRADIERFLDERRIAAETQ